MWTLPEWWSRKVSSTLPWWLQVSGVGAYTNKDKGSARVRCWGPEVGGHHAWLRPKARPYESFVEPAASASSLDIYGQVMKG